MKPKSMALALGLCLLGFGIAYAQHPNPFLGTWTPKEAKSEVPAGGGRITKIVWEAAGQNIKETVYATDENGKQVRSEWAGKFNGRYYPVTDGGPGVTMAVTLVGRTLTYTAKQGGKIVAHGRAVASADGKTASDVSYATDAAGKSVRLVAVYDKE